MRDIMAHMGLHENLKYGLCPKCAATAAKLETLWSTHNKEKYAYEKFYGKMPYYEKH